MGNGKKIFESKTIWVNAIAIVGDILLNLTGHGLPAGSDVIILGVINTILRVITKDPIIWN